MLFGIDISHHNKISSFDKYDFYIQKATEGKSYIDPTFKSRSNQLEQSGKSFGFYHYARPENNTAQDEAYHFATQIEPFIGKSVLALDWEGNALKCDTEWAFNWCKYVHLLTGVIPMIYASASVLPSLTKCKLLGCGLWVAHYGASKPKINPWAFYAIWQYGTVDHLPSKTLPQQYEQFPKYDVDVFNGSVRQWNKYCLSDKKV